MIKLPASQHDITKEKAEVIELEAREERKRFLQLSRVYRNGQTNKIISSEYFKNRIYSKFSHSFNLSSFRNNEYGMV